MKRYQIFFASVAVGSSSIIALSGTAQAFCADTYTGKFGHGAGHKAFAMTAAVSSLSDPKKFGSYSCGWSVNQPTRAVAVEVALAFCASERARNDRKGKCRTVSAQ